MSLTLYCGNCRKSAATGTMNELKTIILSKPLVCAKCDKEVVKDGLALFCEPAKNEVFALRLVKKPAPVKPVANTPVEVPVVKSNHTAGKRINGRRRK